MLVVEDNTISYDYFEGLQVSPIDTVAPLIICFDPSKSNMAMIIGTEYGEILKIIEFSGNNRKRGPAMDTSVYCQQFKSFIASYLKNATLSFVAIEKVITKKSQMFHNSNVVMNEIRSNLKDVFMRELHFNVAEINNWSWKHAVLPEGYRSQSEKGSKRFIAEQFPGNPLNYYFEADVTDCFCLYMFVLKTYFNGLAMICNKSEAVNEKTRDYLIYPSTMDSFPNSMHVAINEHFSIQENVTFICNRTNKACLGTIENVSALRPEEIYGHTRGFSSVCSNNKATILILPK